MAATLPTNITAKGTGHPALHNAVNAAVNEHDARIAALEAGGGTGTGGGQGPQGVGVASITDTDGDGVATVTLHDPRTGTDSTSSLPLPRGLKGDPGTPGAPGKDGVTPATPAFTASATTLAAGSAATAAVSGTYPNLTLALGIPRGADGTGGSGGGGTSSHITGAGRPDVTSTMTSDVQAQVAAATIGTTFISTDGPHGAWAWRKRTSGWVVIDGDTGWRMIGWWTGPVSPAIATFEVKRRASGIACRAHFVATPEGQEYHSATIASADWGAGTPGDNPYIVAGQLIANPGNNLPKADGLIGVSDNNGVQLNAKFVSGMNGREFWWRASWLPPTDAWPTTLPGNPTS